MPKRVVLYEKVFLMKGFKSFGHLIERMEFNLLDNFPNLSSHLFNSKRKYNFWNVNSFLFLFQLLLPTWLQMKLSRNGKIWHLISQQHCRVMEGRFLNQLCHLMLHQKFQSMNRSESLNTGTQFLWYPYMLWLLMTVLDVFNFISIIHYFILSNLAVDGQDIVVKDVFQLWNIYLW